MAQCRRHDPISLSDLVSSISYKALSINPKLPRGGDKLTFVGWLGWVESGR
tara:strand:+ start:342 stop:494 length:153 start_codon:yes stop_codon:yes gene_type:complete